MGYRNKNVLLKMVEIQNIVLKYKRKGLTQKYVYEKEIYPKYLISFATFNRYLSYPAKFELKNGKKKES